MVAALNKSLGLTVDQFTALVSATFDTSAPHLDLDGVPSPFISVFEDDDDDNFFASDSPSPRQLSRHSALSILRKVKSKATNFVQGSSSAPPRSLSTDLFARSGTPFSLIPPSRPATSLLVKPRAPRPRSQSIPNVLAALAPSVKQPRPSVESHSFLDEDFYHSADTTIRPSISLARPSTPGSQLGHDSQQTFLRPRTPSGSPKSQGQKSDFVRARSLAHFHLGLRSDLYYVAVGFVTK